MKVLIILSLVALCCAKSSFQTGKKYTQQGEIQPYSQYKHEAPLKEPFTQNFYPKTFSQKYYPEYQQTQQYGYKQQYVKTFPYTYGQQYQQQWWNPLSYQQYEKTFPYAYGQQYQQKWNPMSYQQYGKTFPTTFEQQYQVPVEFQQWFSEVPVSHPLYKYMLQYQEYYQQGLYPIVFQIYEQLTPAQTLALETLVEKIGFQHVEVLFNYFIGNHFYFAPEQYQLFVSVIEKFGYQYLEQFFQQFVGQKYYLGLQQKYVSFKPVFIWEYVMRELQQYTLPEYKQYYQYYQEYQHSPMFYQKWFQPYYQQYQGYQPNQYQYYPYQYSQGFKSYQPMYHQYQYPQTAY